MRPPTKSNQLLLVVHPKNFIKIGRHYRADQRCGLRRDCGLMTRPVSGQ